jgi:signal transduction histidine kinase
VADPDRPRAPAHTRLFKAAFRGRFTSVRARTTLVGVVVVGGALAVGAVGLLGLLRASMSEGVETTARAQLNDVSSLLRLGQLPAQLPSGRGDTFTQVVASDGRVLATSATLLTSAPMSHQHPGEEGAVISTIPTLSGGAIEDGSDSDGPYLLLAQSFPAPPGPSIGGPVTVYVAATLHPVVAATRTVGLALAAGLPVLTILVAGLIWIFGGRALRPVEAIRAEVSDISGHDLNRRVPEPQTRDEVAHLARTMNEMLDRLESYAGAQHRFVADASHELRSPLASLQTTLEVALAHPATASWPLVVTEALEESQRLQRLVEDLLVLARVDENGQPEGQEEVDLDDIVLLDTRRRRPCGVEIDLHRVSAGRVLGSPDQLARVVHNLMDNAQRHATARIVLELSTNPENVLLVVQDDGPGVAREERDRVFDRFARLDEARSQDSGGTGLGLAIAKEIVRAHGGTICIADSRAGARFEVRLPALVPEIADRCESVAINDDDSRRASASASVDLGVEADR